ncbi:hypothetical protein LJR219_003186 [Phenylobacterium sp. LjRoot219]|uniref:hypothetical protein n=1 Tax=Phenylobacterium sp. LjRoot219 TaxID=3342283 RepID=UPI003ED03D65
MNGMFLAALVAGAALTAAPAMAQDYGASGSAMSGSASKDAKKMTPEQMRAHCKSMMNQEKSGQAPSASMSGGKTYSDADMKKMHDKCAAMMGKDKTAPSTSY